jgi:hypothetical protein
MAKCWLKSPPLRKVLKRPTESLSHLAPWMRDLKDLRTDWKASEFSKSESLARS